MSGWVRDFNSKHVNIAQTNLNNNELEPEFEKKKMVEGRPKILNNIFYPPWTTKPSCFKILAPDDVTFERKPQYIYMLPKFTDTKDAYLFLQKFEKVYSMMYYPNVPVDTVQLEVIPCALKDDVEKWMYGLPTNLIINWDGFAQVFLRKYFLNSKIVTLKNETNLFV